MRNHTLMLILCALFAALTAVGAFLRLPAGAMSITLQFFFTAMAALLLGPRWGALSQIVYLVGIPYMYLIFNGYLGRGMSLSAVLWAGMLVYLPGDAVKIAAAALLAKPLLRALPRQQA